MVLRQSSYSDGARVTINDFLKDPLLIPGLILDMVDQEFVAESLLRPAGNTDSGVVKFYESTPLFADGDPAVRAEFGEVEVVPTSLGEPRVAYAEERALAIMVSDEMQRRNNVDRVNQQLTQVRNSMVLSWDTTVLNLLIASAGHTVTAQAPWNQVDSNGVPTSNIRDDVIDAVHAIENAVAANNQNSPFGFEADTMVINKVTKTNLLKSLDYNDDVFRGNIASENLRYRGLLPNKIFDLDVLVSRTVPPGKVIIMQRGTAGFLVDELPMQATPLYRDEPRKSWRSDVQRASAMGIDQPLAVAVIDGVGTTIVRDELPEPTP